MMPGDADRCAAVAGPEAESYALLAAPGVGKGGAAAPMWGSGLLCWRPLLP